MGFAIEGVVETGGEAGPDLGTLLASADPAAGEKVFAKCSSCRSADEALISGHAAASPLAPAPGARHLCVTWAAPPQVPLSRHHIGL